MQDLTNKHKSWNKIKTNNWSKNRMLENKSWDKYKQSSWNNKQYKIGK